jgi:hypothetical protein
MLLRLVDKNVSDISIEVSSCYPSVANARTAERYPAAVTHHKLRNVMLSLTNDWAAP